MPSVARAADMCGNAAEGVECEGELLRSGAAYATCVSACHAVGMMQLLQLAQVFAACQASCIVCAHCHDGMRCGRHTMIPVVSKARH